MKQRLLLLLAVVYTSTAFAGGTFPLTYQGSLSENGIPANGIYDFNVGIYDSASASSPLVFISADDVEVTDGVFTFELAVNSSLLDLNLWLEITVRDNGIAEFTVLSPRQQVIPAAQALLADTVSDNSIDSLHIVNGSISIDDVNTTQIQARASVVCQQGFAIAGIGEDGSVTCRNLNVGALTSWSLDGNAGTTAGTDFLGTTDDEPLEIHVNDNRIWRSVWEPGGAGQPGPSIVAGDPNNSIAPGSVGSTIAGGGNPIVPNSIAGASNTIGGGLGNQINGGSATIAGGSNNSATGTGATIGGGSSNEASGDNSTVPGGQLNTAAGRRSVAMGHQAIAAHENTFVFNDGGGTFSSTGNGQFLIDVSDGVGIGEDNPTDLLHINAPPGRDALRVQTDGTTRLRVHENGGVSIGLNSTPPAAGLLVEGEIELANPVTRWFTIPANAFVPTESSSVYRSDNGEISATDVSGTNGEEFAAYLTLPHGAQVIALRASVLDDVAVGDLRVRIVRRQITGNFSTDVMATIATAAQVNGTQTLFDTTIDMPVIDNEFYTYAVEFDTDGAGGLRLYNARVTYLTDSVLP